MNIAMMVRGFLPTPVPGDIAYSPATVAYSVAEGLAKKGHRVVFFGPEGTEVEGCEVVTLSTRPTVSTQKELDEFVGRNDLFATYLPSLYDGVLARNMFDRAQAGEFDCVIFHHFESVLTLAPLYPDVKTVFILHDFIDPERKQAIEMHASSNISFISISENQRRNAPDLNYLATIYNGTDIDTFEHEDDAEAYLLISGRVTPSKGQKEAVQIAMQTNRRLLISGQVSGPDSWYFDEHIKPFLNDKILYLGMLEREQLVKYYQKAAALLMPIHWEEPFGLSMIEANACGTPVIALNRGSVPEVIEDGKNGFIANNSAEMIMAIDKIDKIKRKDCRNHVVKNFSNQKMINAYEKALEELTSSNKAVKRHPAKSSLDVSSKKIRASITKLSKRIIDTKNKQKSRYDRKKKR